MNKEQEKVIYQNMDKEMLIEIVLNFKENSMRLLEENAELRAKLENAIVPKFKIGQEVWIIGFTDNKYGIYRTPIKKVVTAIIQKNDGFNYCELNEEKTFYIDLDIFATKQEAEDILKKLES